MCVGKAGGGPSTPQAEITKLLVRLGRAGHTVVRLKGGDPFVFGRGGEEALALRAAGIPFEIVPGISAGIAGPAYAGIPVTHRGLARSAAFVTGHEDPTADGPAIDWSALARLDTLVVFMAGRTTGTVAGRLLAAGRTPDTPAVVIVDASLPSQEVRPTDLGTIARQGTGITDGRPALLVIGAVAALTTELAWFDGAGVDLRPSEASR
ncbi:MAG TPA: uroporphyrinogen-III C-methyltransferase [Candidatus Limnocylindrales bacterium]|jgi:uroporphyrin-III C-methyltransferase|nr:uroporphyrinogen-III C-methyltransferase [Candidatus Limnocylindrales bacterium]